MNEDTWECIGNWMNCKICSNLHVCFDLKPKDSNELRRNCTTCKICEGKDVCSIITLKEIVSNPYTRAELENLDLAYLIGIKMEM